MIETTLIAVAAIAIWAFNVFGMSKELMREFGRITRGDLIFICFIALVLPVGFIFAAKELLRIRINFDKQVWPRP